MPFCGRCPHPTSGIEREISGNNTNAEGIDREREWVRAVNGIRNMAEEQRTFELKQRKKREKC